MRAPESGKGRFVKEIRSIQSLIAIIASGRQNPASRRRIEAFGLFPYCSKMGPLGFRRENHPRSRGATICKSPPGNEARILS